MDGILNINERIDYIAVTYFKGNNSLFAREMDTSETNIRNYRQGTTPKLDFIHKLNHKLGISFEWIIDGELPMMRSEDISQAPVHSDSGTENKNSLELPLLDFSAYAGYGDDFSEQNTNYKKRLAYPFLNKGDADFALRISGDSMSPTILNGDIVACKVIQNIHEIKWSRTHVLYTEGQGVIIKRLIQGESEIDVICRSDNPLYEDFHIDKRNVLNIAFVVNTMRTFP